MEAPTHRLACSDVDHSSPAYTRSADLVQFIDRILVAWKCDRATPSLTVVHSPMFGRQKAVREIIGGNTLGDKEEFDEEIRRFVITKGSGGFDTV